MSNTLSSHSHSGGIGFTGLLMIVFIVLKLTGYISWSWVWVLSPIWIGLVLVLIVFIIAFLILLSIKCNRRIKHEHKTDENTY